MTRTLAERLQAERERQFVGRSAELQRFRSALGAAELPFCLWHIFGPGGVGKTTLLQALVRDCQAAGVPHALLDGRQIEAVPDSFLSALRSHLPPSADIAEAIAEAAGPHGRYVLLIDTYEQLSPIDSWLHQDFITTLPAATLVVLAGRQPPAPAWQTDMGWQAMTAPLALRNFRPEESQVYLTQRQVPTEDHPSILSFTHGHPLALSLVADMFAQGQVVSFQPDETPDLVKLLLERFVEQLPSHRHRAALEASACVRTLSESLLGQLLDQPDVHDLFDWLRQLSFMAAQASGLFPHDVVREVLIADLRWRAPDWYETLHQRARRYYSDRLGKTQGAEQHSVLFDYIFLHRDHAAIRNSFTWQETSSLGVTGMVDGDRPDLLAMVKAHEGEASAALAADWLAQQPEGVLVFREADQTPAGFLVRVTLDEQTVKTAAHDPAVLSTWRYLQSHAPLRSGEAAVLFRFWMGKTTYQAVSPVQSLIFITFVQHHRASSNLAYTFFCCAQPQDWAQMFAYADLDRLPGADFAVAGQTYGVYGHDWRILSPTAWQALLAQRELTPAAQPERTTLVVVLSQPDFETAVREALKVFTQPEALLKNPLVRSHLTHPASEAALTDRVAALQTLILEAADTLKATPKQTKYYRALYHTYLDPAPSQEAAAEVLDLPFSTFRRHLKAGITEVTDFLWQREVGEAAP